MPVQGQTFWDNPGWRTDSGVFLPGRRSGSWWACSRRWQWAGSCSNGSGWPAGPASSCCRWTRSRGTSGCCRSSRWRWCSSFGTSLQATVREKYDCEFKCLNKLCLIIKSLSGFLVSYVSSYSLHAFVESMVQGKGFSVPFPLHYGHRPDRIEWRLVAWVNPAALPCWLN